MHLNPLIAENSLFKAVGDIFHPLFVGVATVLAYIYGIVPNFAVAIILLTLLIMALLTPLTIKSTRSMLAMQALQPEMQKLRQKYKGAENREQLNQEMMKLYREQGVSPTGGCLPMFLQMPALIVLYDVIKGLANTVKLHDLMGTGKKKCLAKVCATPRYIPHTSAMYQRLVKSPGVMKSFGLNLAAKPLTHHSSWEGYVPYFALLLVAVGLQYFQMAQITRRNKRNNMQQQVPQQMQTMQRVMPLIFAYIYFLVPAGVVIYMIVSSGVRVLTQDLIFRFGLVQAPGARQLRPAGAGASAVVDAKSSTSARTVGGKAAGAQGGKVENGKGSAGKQPGQAQSPTQRTRGGAANGKVQPSTNGQAQGAGPKQHPRSRSKRERKER